MIKYAKVLIIIPLYICIECFSLQNMPINSFDSMSFNLSTTEDVSPSGYTEIVKSRDSGANCLVWTPSTATYNYRMWFWVHYSKSLGLSFIICKTGIIIISTSWVHWWLNQLIYVKHLIQCLAKSNHYMSYMPILLISSIIVWIGKQASKSQSQE